MHKYWFAMFIRFPPAPPHPIFNRDSFGLLKQGPLKNQAIVFVIEQLRVQKKSSFSPAATSLCTAFLMTQNQNEASHFVPAFYVNLSLLKFRGFPI